MTTNEQKTKKVAWYDFCFNTVPADWEVTGYSLSEMIGKLEFNSRHGYEGRIAWQRLKHEPDIEQIMNDFHKRFLITTNPGKKENLEHLHFSHIGPFRWAYNQDGEPCQAAAYLPECKTLILCLFPEYSENFIKTIFAPMLKSFQPNTGDTKQWALFGLDFQLPAAFMPETVKILPADVFMQFESKKTHAKVNMHRWGLSSVLLEKLSLDRFYRTILLKLDGSDCSVDDASYHKHKAVRARFKQRGTIGMDKLMGSYWNCEGLCWLNSDEQRIYAVEQIGPPKVDYLEVDDVIHI